MDKPIYENPKPSKRVRIRADQLLVDQNLAPTRSKAQALIMAGLVRAGERTIDKAGDSLPSDTMLEIISAPHPYVSRGGLKLEKALDTFEIPVEGSVCIDAGASTGGFTHCLLLRGATRVYSVDVGYGQLDLSLREDPRVVVIERCNVRYLTREQVPEDADIITADLSFISLTKVMVILVSFLKTGGYFIPLVKPQFELEPREVKKGVVKDPKSHERAVRKIVEFGETIGLETIGTVESPIKGPKGNTEFLACFRKVGK